MFQAAPCALLRECAVALIPVALGATACARAPAGLAPFQGVIEFDERLLGFETAGRVVRVKVHRGDSVRAGDVLATLDDALERTSRDNREAEAEAAKARADLLRAGSRSEQIRAMDAQVRGAEANEATLRKKYQREKQLRADEAVTQAQLDDTEGRLKAAVAEREGLEQRVIELRKGTRKEELKSADAQAAAAATSVKLEAEKLQRRQLRAPQDGTVLDVHVEEGEVVNVGTPVLTVADTAHPYADIFIPQARIGGVRVGCSASVRVDSLRETLTGSVENVARATEFTPRYLFSDRERPNLVVRTRVRIEDPKQLLHAGIPAFVTLDCNAKSAKLP